MSTESQNYAASVTGIHELSDLTQQALNRLDMERVAFQNDLKNSLTEIRGEIGKITERQSAMSGDLRAIQVQMSQAQGMGDRIARLEEKINGINHMLENNSQDTWRWISLIFSILALFVSVAVGFQKDMTSASTNSAPYRSR